MNPQQPVMATAVPAALPYAATPGQMQQPLMADAGAGAGGVGAGNAKPAWQPAAGTPNRRNPIMAPLRCLPNRFSLDQFSVSRYVDFAGTPQKRRKFFSYHPREAFELSRPT